ncbi:putative methyltransferase-domain-containing protein [Echria macrotheca]|uniref:Methyltransferase-domain-containing protein n=1 Tax=Echria macrotheca TaxID=438768 RepID=A0AAJ0B3M0_9PEZI|nr:putative methyltransferase-domain-containing protein [Echria macrotheca]
MRPAAGRPLPPTSSLPSLRRLDELTESRLFSALDDLFAIYCPVSVPKLAFEHVSKPSRRSLLNQPPPLTDSGYNSGYPSDNEDDDDEKDSPEGHLAPIRTDELERAFAIKWLERLVSCAADEDPRPACFSSDEAQQSVLEQAADLLVALLNPVHDGVDHPDENQDEEDGFWREFTFAMPDRLIPITVRLNDGLAGAADHTDVGLQTWGASIVLCRMLCESPSRFGVTRDNLGPSPKIVELGAGTGLVSLCLGQLFPRLGIEQVSVVATDYHPSVIANLERNIAANSVDGTSPVQACVLDWADTKLEGPMQEVKADMIIATDVVYAPEHAAMLYDCASRILAPGGTFWLLQTVRQNGRHGDHADSVEPVFGDRALDEKPGVLKILSSERLEKVDGVGRGDETFYRLFRIGRDA